MYHFTSQSLTASQRYKLISGSLVPRPIAWVTTLNKDDATIVNAAPFSYFSSMPSDTPLLSLAIGRQTNFEPKDTAANILAREEAVVHLVDADLAREMNQTAATLPADQSEVTQQHLATIPSQTISVPALALPKIRFETELYQYVPITDDQGRIQGDLFILKITDFYFKEDVLDPKQFHVDARIFNPLARLAGPTYGQIDHTFNLQRPK